MEESECFGKLMAKSVITFVTTLASGTNFLTVFRMGSELVSADFLTKVIRYPEPNLFFRKTLDPQQSI